MAKGGGEHGRGRGAAGPGAARPTSRWRWLWRLLWLALALAIAGAAAGAIVWTTVESQLPEVTDFSSYAQVALETSRVVAAGGEPLARFGKENRTIVPPAQIPRLLRVAVVAAEDASFYHHPGLDLLGIARALWVDVVAGRYKQGASTITQQFAKTRFLSSEKTVTRKLKELILARRLEQKASKDEILAMYLNEIYYGHGAYGCEEAARLYFGKTVAALDIAEAALLAGVVNSPGRWSPLVHPERARKRRRYVLEQMRDRGYIGAEDAARAAEAPLPSQAHEEITQRAPWVVAAVRREIEGLIASGRLDEAAWARGGLRVEVAIDAIAQAAAERAVADGLRAIDDRLGVHRPMRHLADDAAIATERDRLRASQALPPPAGQALHGIVLGQVGAAQDEAPGYRVALGVREGLLAHADVARYLRPDRAAEALFRRGDVIRVGMAGEVDGTLRLVPELGPQAALVALEPGTGLIRALIGGDDARLHPFHRALDASRQPGSTFKTFVYGAALDAGTHTPETTRRDERHAWPTGGRPWTPRNFTGSWDGRPHTLRDALARSINSIAVEVASEVGPGKVAAFARQLGIESPLRADLPLALGASSVRPVELAEAYATIAAEGVRARPILVTRVLDRDGGELLRASPQPQRAIRVNTARSLGDMLGDVARRGSARGAKVGHPFAGKTGTTNGGRDAWFVGYTAQLCAAVWVGYDDRTPMAKASGATDALPIWAAFVRGALDRVPVRPLPRLPQGHAGAFEAPPLEADHEGAAATTSDEDATPAPTATEGGAMPAGAIDDTAIE